MRDPELEKLLLEEKVIETESQINRLKLELEGLRRRLEKTRLFIELAEELGYDWRTPIEGDTTQVDRNKVPSWKLVQPQLPRCKLCKTVESTQWWKCCPKHTTQDGSDVLCSSCALDLHPSYKEE